MMGFVAVSTTVDPVRGCVFTPPSSAPPLETAFSVCFSKV